MNVPIVVPADGSEQPFGSRPSIKITSSLALLGVVGSFLSARTCYRSRVFATPRDRSRSDAKIRKGGFSLDFCKKVPFLNNSW